MVTETIIDLIKRQDRTAEADLPENKLRRVEAKGVAVLLVRRSEHIYAIAQTCSHLSRPLAEGTLEGDTVRCPWHHSSFSLTDVSVVGSPAITLQSCFEVRAANKQLGDDECLTSQTMPELLCGFSSLCSKRAATDSST